MAGASSGGCWRSVVGTNPPCHSRGAPPRHGTEGPGRIPKGCGGGKGSGSGVGAPLLAPRVLPDPEQPPCPCSLSLHACRSLFASSWSRGGAVQPLAAGGRWFAGVRPHPKPPPRFPQSLPACQAGLQGSQEMVLQCVASSTLAPGPPSHRGGPSSTPSAHPWVLRAPGKLRQGGRRRPVPKTGRKQDSWRCRSLCPQARVALCLSVPAPPQPKPRSSPLGSRRSLAARTPQDPLPRPHGALFGSAPPPGAGCLVKGAIVRPRGGCGRLRRCVWPGCGAGFGPLPVPVPFARGSCLRAPLGCRPPASPAASAGWQDACGSTRGCCHGSHEFAVPRP